MRICEFGCSSSVGQDISGVPDRLLQLRRLGRRDFVAQGSGNLTHNSAWLPEQRLFLAPSRLNLHFYDKAPTICLRVWFMMRLNAHLQGQAGFVRATQGATASLSLNLTLPMDGSLAVGGASSRGGSSAAASSLSPETTVYRRALLDHCRRSLLQQNSSMLTPSKSSLLQAVRYHGMCACDHVSPFCCVQ